MAQPCGCPENTGCGCLLTAGDGIDVSGVGSAAAPYVVAATTYRVIQDEGTPLVERDTLNFIGPAVEATDDAGNMRTDVTITAPGGDFVRKSASESVTSSTALQNDDHLVLPVVANAVYKVVLHIILDASTAGDFKQDFTAPAGSSMAWGEAFTGNGFETPGGVSVRQGAGAGTFLSHHVEGTLTTAGTPGNLQVRWAQNTSDGTATRVRPGSSLKLERWS